MNKINKLALNIALFLSLSLMAGSSLHARAQNNLTLSIQKMAEKTAQKLNGHGGILVEPLRDRSGKSTEFGGYLADQLGALLSDEKDVFLIKWSPLNPDPIDLKNAKKKNLSEDQFARKIGKSLGANIIITGTMTDLSQELVVNLRIVNVKNSVPSGRVIHHIQKSPDVLALLDNPGISKRRVVEIQMEDAIRERIRQINENKKESISVKKQPTQPPTPNAESTWIDLENSVDSNDW